MLKLPVLTVSRRCTLGAPEERDFFCQVCREPVYALSRRTEDEALEVLQRPGGVPCVSFRTDTRGAVSFRGARTGAMLGLVLAAGCASARPEPMRTPETATEAAGITIGQAAFVHPYQVEGANVNSPTFGALTTTIIIDGRRRHFGVGG